MRRSIAILLLSAITCSADPNWTSGASQGLGTTGNINPNTLVVSVAFWLLLRSTNTTQVIYEHSTTVNSATVTTPRFNAAIDNHSGWKFYAQSRCGNYVRSGFDATKIPLNVWTHIGVVHDISTAVGTNYVWINGVKQTTIVVNGLPNAGSNTTSPYQAAPFFIGSRNAGTVPMNGAISELAIWNSALTDAQFESLAAGMRPISIGVQPLHFWPLHPVLSEILGDPCGGLSLNVGTYANTNSTPLKILRP